VVSRHFGRVWRGGGGAGPDQQQHPDLDRAAAAERRDDALVGTRARAPCTARCLSPGSAPKAPAPSLHLPTPHTRCAARRHSVDGKAFVPEYPTTINYASDGALGTWSHWSLDHYSSGADADTAKLCATGACHGHAGARSILHARAPQRPACRQAADSSPSPACGARRACTGRNLGSQYARYTWDPATASSRANAAAYETAATFANRRMGWRAEACSTSIYYVCALPSSAAVFNCRPPPPNPPPPSPSPPPPLPPPPSPAPPPPATGCEPRATHQ
jgi:hypothetical protein